MARLHTWGFGQCPELPEGLFAHEVWERSLRELRALFANAEDMRGTVGDAERLLPLRTDGTLMPSVVTIAPWGIVVANGKTFGITWNELFTGLPLSRIQELLKRAADGRRS